LSKDCLDGTDERFDNEVIQHEDPFNLFINVNCLITITFVCEEKTCCHLRTFSCGDGECFRISCPNDPTCFISSSFPYLDSSAYSCQGTRRDISYSQSIYTTTRNLLGDCYKLLSCKIKFYSDFFNNTYNEEECLSSSSYNCSMEWISFPSEPIFGYFQFIYLTKNLMYNQNDSILPDYICNDPRQCLYLSKSTFQIGGLDCRSFKQYITMNYEYYIFYLYDVVSQLIEQCFLMGNRMKLTSNSSLFFCQYSQRYISKYRLLDSFPDCYFREDEPNSCAYNDPLIYSCKWINECLSLLNIDYNFDKCKNHYDKPDFDSPENIFQRICNGIDNKIRENVYIDQSNCELWPCYNPYTRCDDYFQCANLIDEIGCPKYNCNANELKCIIDYSDNYRCIKTRPNLRFPRNLFYSINFTNHKNEKYILWKNQTCLTISDLCHDEPIGMYDDGK
jgi:hypothetical protein